MKFDKSLVLNQIKLHLGFDKDKQFADFLGIKPQTLSSWQSRNTYDTELLYSKCSDLNPSFLLTGEGELLKSEVISTASVANTSNIDGIENVIPLIPYSAIAGFGSGDVPAIMEHDIIDRYVVPGLKYVDFLIRVDGDSMEPTYEKGDVIACQIIHDGSFIQWGKTFVLDTEQGVLLKRLQPGLTENEYLCKSDNPNYQEFAIPKKQINNLALVKGLIRIE